MTAKLEIRLAKCHDQPALLALQWRASLTNDEDRPHLLANPEVVVVPAEQIASGQVILAEADGQLAGFAVVLPREPGEAELDGLFVEPDLWRRGVGKALVQAVETMALEQGCAWMHVVANPAALGFYERIGFVAYGEAKVQFGRAIGMRKRLGR